jgi:bidirectional [NiFe] hydrogenase diaphorase subunit
MTAPNSFSLIQRADFAERNHVCSVCVANRHCELQDLAVRLGLGYCPEDRKHSGIVIIGIITRFKRQLP